MLDKETAQVQSEIASALSVAIIALSKLIDIKLGPDSNFSDDLATLYEKLGSAQSSVATKSVFEQLSKGLRFD